MQWLDSSTLDFPPYSEISPEGIIALGGDVSPERLIKAYSLGIFPWYNKEEPIIWWCPDPRFVLYPSDLKISHSMRQIQKKNIFRYTENCDFYNVIRQCQLQKRKGQNGTWIQDEMIESYVELHKMGYAKSVEVYNLDNELVGGLYGISIGKIFSGESMFSIESNASKFGFIEFVKNHSQEYTLIDCQVYTQHLESLGAKNIPRNVFLQELSS